VPAHADLPVGHLLDLTGNRVPVLPLRLVGDGEEDGEDDGRERELRLRVGGCHEAP
jgi:hypothetical protein